ncbi:hypothetical protein PCANC_24545, partial [Puccinia coronata f. sp. avenae]
SFVQCFVISHRLPSACLENCESQFPILLHISFLLSPIPQDLLGHTFRNSPLTFVNS